MTKTKNIQKKEHGKYLVEVKNLKKWFPVQTNFIDQLLVKEREYVRAVDGVSFNIMAK